jgi:endoglycosylceramidase
MLGRLRLLAALSLVVTGLLVYASAPAAAAPAGPLGHAGRWITDASGRVFITHGMNMVYKLPPYHPAAVGFGDDDAAFLASEGYNTVRVGIIYKGVEPAPGVYDEAYLDQIAHTVKTLAAHGVFSMLDFHQDLYNELFQGEGWPDWAVRDDGLPNQPQTGFPGNYIVMPALQRAFDHFWNNDPAQTTTFTDTIGLQDRYAAAWRHVAARFRGNPNVLGYELLNEPWPGTTWQTCANNLGCPVFDAIMTQFIKRTLAAIRMADPSTLIWYEPNVLFNDGADTNVGSTGDRSTGFAFHDYCLSAGFNGTDNPDCDTFDNLVFANAEKHSAATGAALLMTEFGATDDRAILNKMTGRADQSMVSWQEWQYCGCSDPTTSGPGAKQAIVLDPAKPPTGDNLKPAKLELLSRAYPQVVAGTPQSFSFDPDTKVFALRYATARAGGGALPAGSETEIVLPQRQYPSGYAAAVQGASIRSLPGSTLLRVGACPGVGEVAVRVQPGSGRSQTCTPPPPFHGAGGGGRTGSRKLHIHLSVSPRSTSAGRSTLFTFHTLVWINRRLSAVRGVKIRFAGGSVITGRRGTASMRVRLRSRGRRTVRATKRGLFSASTTVRVR